MTLHRISFSLFSHLYHSLFLSPTHKVYGSSIVWHCLPRGRGSAPCPYQCRVMVVFPVCNKSRRWHRMSAASCAGTPNMYPLAPNTLHWSQRKCYRGACLVAPNTQRMFSANSSHICLPEIKDSCMMLTSG